jgi:hypothetical protein
VPPAPLFPTLAGFGAHGIEQMAILMANDAGLPLGGPGFDNRKEKELVETVERVTKALRPYPAFRGWSWASNWWVFGQRGSAAARSPEEKKAYEAALKRAKETGRWDEVLERVADRRLTFAAEAQGLFNRTLRKVGPGLKTASAAPYRNVESYPPLSLANVDEVDLQAQWEQVAVPYATPHGVDFYRRPGKRAWAHPEIWNDAGTGEQVLPTLFQALMRGANGVGCSGPLPPWGRLPEDDRNGYYGTVSVYRALGGLLRQYGPWLASLENDDRVAIAVSGRMLKIDDWPHVYGTHFARLLEAYAACLHAHRPASFVFAEDVKAGSFDRFKAVLVVGQRVEMEPKLLDALRKAQKAGVKVFHDGTCRPELVRGFTPLGLSFDHFEKDRHPASDDSAYERFPGYLKETVPALRKALAEVPPVAETDNPELLLSQRTDAQGDARYVFVVNNTTPELSPGQMWRVSLLSASRVPVKARLKLGTKGAVYDVFAGRRVEAKDGVIEADCRDLPGRVFAVLPKPIRWVELLVPAEASPGDEIVGGVWLWSDVLHKVRASVPYRMRLLTAKGELLDEQFARTEPFGTFWMNRNYFRVPLNVPGEALILDVTELFSGLSATQRIKLLRPRRPLPSLTKLAPRKGPLFPDSGTNKNRRAPDWRPADDAFGPHVRDVAVSPDGTTAYLNAFNWDQNLYALDLDKGAVRGRQRLGHYFAFAPQALPDGVAVQGFDFHTAEGYHLYLAGRDGAPARRFALYGLPNRLPHRFVPGILRDRINNFAVAPNGSWVASAGDLGLAVWARDGKLLWAEHWWKTARHTARLVALDGNTLLVVEGLKARAVSARDGKQVWEHTLAPSGEVRAARASADGRTCAFLTTTDGGRVFVLRDGKPERTIPAGGDDLALSADGERLALTSGRRLDCYEGAGLVWSLPGDDVLHFPRFSPDGKRLACSSELGTVYVVDGGALRLERDLGALAVPAWLPGGDLLLATWMGTVQRLGPDYSVKWQTKLRSTATDLRGKLLTRNEVPTTRIADWGNAEPTARPLAPNLLGPRTARVEFRSTQPHVQFVRPPDALLDGKADSPPGPWLSWSDVGWFAEGGPKSWIQLDTFRRRLRVEALTLVEDKNHPESWLRDARLEYWDTVGERWRLAAELLSDSAAHSHKLPRPVEATRWRIVPPPALVGNLRLAEIVFHGSEAGPSHPDVIAKRPVAVLFDEGDDLKEAGLVGHSGLSFAFGGAYSGGRYLRLEADRHVAPPFLPPFGHELRNWDFEIAEMPGPGQYRYLQFAWRALSPATKGMTLRLDGDGYGRSVSLHAGEYRKEDGTKDRKVADRLPADWQVVRVDLWEALG